MEALCGTHPAISACYSSPLGGLPPPAGHPGASGTRLWQLSPLEFRAQHARLCVGRWAEPLARAAEAHCPAPAPLPSALAAGAGTAKQGHWATPSQTVLLDDTGR